MGQNARQRPARGAVDDLAGDRVDGKPTPPELLFEVRPMRAMDLAHVPAIRTPRYFDALVAAGRMSDGGAPCIVWIRRAEVAA